VNSSVLRYAAFTDQGAGGNPAGVVLDANGLENDARLAIAAAVNYSETAFVEPVSAANITNCAPDAPREYNVRYFSPLAQVAFCGHATIATAVALADRDGPGSLIFHTLAGPIPIETRHSPRGTTATLISPPTSTRAAEPEEISKALNALRWQDDDLDPRYPAHVSFAGNNHLVIAAASRERLADLDYDYPTLAELMRQRKWTTVHLVFAERPDLFHARDPFPPGGVVEDPATGAAAAAFGGYLRALGLSEVPGRVTILQGADMGRPSRLLVDLQLDDDRVAVTGVASRIPDDDR
jgi:PhzF family phenazine biosynthesis protein